MGYFENIPPGSVGPIELPYGIYIRGGNLRIGEGANQTSKLTSYVDWETELGLEDNFSVEGRIAPGLVSINGKYSISIFGNETYHYYNYIDNESEAPTQLPIISHYLESSFGNSDLEFISYVNGVYNNYYIFTIADRYYREISEFTFFNDKVVFGDSVVIEGDSYLQGWTEVNDLHTVKISSDTFSSPRVYSDLDIYIGDNRSFDIFADDGSTFRNIFRLNRSVAANETALLVWDNNSLTIKRVSVGTADSGGTGFRLLRIPN